MEMITNWNTFWLPILVIVIGGLMTFYIPKLCTSLYKFFNNHIERSKRIDNNQVLILSKIDETNTKLDKTQKMVGTNFINSNSVRDALIRGTNGDGIIFKASIEEFEANHKSTLNKMEFPYYED